MKTRRVAPFVVVLGFLVLFFFPEPETNFLWYFLTGLLFFAVVVVLIVVDR